VGNYRNLAARLATVNNSSRLWSWVLALQRFFDRQSGNQQVVAPPTFTNRQRIRQIKAAEEELRRAGF
jgi:hypothetical protein